MAQHAHGLLGYGRNAEVALDDPAKPWSGIVTTCMGVTKSFTGLVVCRTLLGLFEAGFFPGMLNERMFLSIMNC